MAEEYLTPRVLELKIKLRVPKGLKRDIRWARIDRALDSIEAYFIENLGFIFPWADKMEFSHEWKYVWAEETRTVTLPASDENTVREADTA
jgi:hypothetical protein